MSRLLLLLAGFVTAAAAATVSDRSERRQHDMTPRPLVVRVLDAETGRPLAGAHVVVDKDSLPVFTDSGGRVLYGGLVDETRKVSVRLPGYLAGSGWAKRDGDTLRASVSLFVDLPRTAQGRVSDAVDKEPRQGAVVVVTPSGRRATTDSVGRFLLDSVPPGEFRLDFSLAGYHQTSQTLKVNGGDAAHLDVAMYQGRLHGILAGRVIDAKTSEPLVGAAVWIEGTDLGNATDLNGEYRIMNLAPGICLVRALHVDYQSASEELFVGYEKPTRLDFKLRQVSHGVLYVR